MYSTWKRHKLVKYKKKNQGRNDRDVHLVGFYDFAVGCVIDITVASASDGALVEGHDVLRERARLVREDVLDLSELLVERGGARLGGRLGLLVKHLLVPVDEEGLGQSDDFHAVVQSDGHDIVVFEKEC